MDPSTISLLVGVALKYGPDLAMELIGLFKSKTVVTVDQVEALFGKMKTYDSYGIPGIAPKAPGVV